jgi:hypothetical protein
MLLRVSNAPGAAALFRHETLAIGFIVVLLIIAVVAAVH